MCVENAGRSQMAERFFRKYAPEGYEPVSAGTKPISQINPLAIQVMSEGDSLPIFWLGTTAFVSSLVIEVEVVVVNA
jgi:hypothetical protein